MELAMPFWIPSANICLLVQNKSSPTTSTLFPSLSVIFFQPVQSFSANPSSIEAIGYWRTQLSQRSIISSLDNSFCELLKNLYFPSSQSSLVAGSRQILTSLPGRSEERRVGKECRS